MTERRELSLFQLGRFCSILGAQMQSVAVGWQVYAMTGRPLDLGYVGLAQFAPAFLLSLVTGMAADKFDRRRIILLCHAAIAASSLLLWQLSQRPQLTTAPIYAVLVFFGCARAFLAPAGQALLPHIVPPARFPKAVAWSASVWQMASILGPALGGVLYARVGGPGLYLLCGGLSIAAVVMVLLMRTRTGSLDTSAVSATTLLAGVRYVFSQPMILGALSLDLFAVLFGGAVALLPIYAKDILHAGPWGFGLLRAAPAVGAAAMALALGRRPIARRNGVVMFVAVIVFGLATILFGLSRSFPLSVVALLIVGASDMISVVIRVTLVQTRTPAEMRGRVSAVNMVFIGASNELGEFESGVTAEWFGAVRSVVVGGIATCAVVGLWAWRFAELRRVDRISA